MGDAVDFYFPSPSSLLAAYPKALLAQNKFSVSCASGMIEYRYGSSPCL